MFARLQKSIVYTLAHTLQDSKPIRRDLDYVSMRIGFTSS